MSNAFNALDRWYHHENEMDENDISSIINAVLSDEKTKNPLDFLQDVVRKYPDYCLPQKERNLFVSFLVKLGLEYESAGVDDENLLLPEFEMVGIINYNPTPEQLEKLFQIWIAKAAPWTVYMSRLLLGRKLTESERSLFVSNSINLWEQEKGKGDCSHIPNLLRSNQIQLTEGEKNRLRETEKRVRKYNALRKILKSMKRHQISLKELQQSQL